MTLSRVPEFWGPLCPLSRRGVSFLHRRQARAAGCWTPPCADLGGTELLLQVSPQPGPQL